MREAVGVKGGRRGEAVIASAAAPLLKQIGGRRAVAKVTVSNVVNLGLRALRRVAQQHSEGRLGKPLWPVRLPDGMEVLCARARGAT